MNYKRYVKYKDSDVEWLGEGFHTESTEFTEMGNKDKQDTAGWG
jgi:hypothetical protein